MDEKEKEKFRVDAGVAIREIREKHYGMVRDYHFSTLVNIKTDEEVGFGVILQLSHRYAYVEEMLNDWKQLFKADDWCISAKRNQLCVTFKVRFK